jgi:hypothetical protein
MASVSFVLVFPMVGCDSGADTKTGTVGTLPPEATQANQNMMDAMKNANKKK